MVHIGGDGEGVERSAGESRGADPAPEDLLSETLARGSRASAAFSADPTEVGRAAPLAKKRSSGRRSRSTSRYERWRADQREKRENGGRSLGGAIFTTLMVGLVAGASLLAVVARPDDLAAIFSPSASETPEMAAARAGLRQVLSDGAGAPLRSVVVGRAFGDGRWDFRAMAVVGPDRKPVYGVVHLLCREDFSRPSCWRIAHLAIDGVASGASETTDAGEKATGSAAKAAN